MESSPEATEVALVDMDGTIADFEGSLRRKLAVLAAPAEPKLTEEDMRHPEPWIEARMTLIKRQPGFWRGLPVIEDGMKVLSLILDAGFSTSILTKGPRRTHSAWSEKIEWAAEHVPGLPVTVSHDKGLVYGRVLFDDFPDYAMSWLKHRPRGVVLMLDSPINHGFEHPQVVRVMRPFDDEVAAVVRAALVRAKSR